MGTLSSKNCSLNCLRGWLSPAKTTLQSSWSVGEERLVKPAKDVAVFVSEERLVKPVKDVAVFLKKLLL